MVDERADDRPFVERRNSTTVVQAVVAVSFFIITFSVVAYSAARNQSWGAIPFLLCGVAFVAFMVRTWQRTTWWFAADRASVTVRYVLGGTVQEPLVDVGAVELTATHQVKLRMLDGRVIDLTGTIGRTRTEDAILAEAIGALGVPKEGLGFRSQR